MCGGIVVAILLGRRFGSARWARPLRFAGRDSLVFYIVHWYGTSAGVALGALSGSGWIAVLCGFVAGLAAGAAFAWLIRLWPPVNWLFTPPRLGTKSVESRSRDSF